MERRLKTKRQFSKEKRKKQEKCQPILENTRWQGRASVDGNSRTFSKIIICSGSQRFCLL
jgi:hypothetical protein